MVNDNKIITLGRLRTYHQGVSVQIAKLKPAYDSENEVLYFGQNAAQSNNRVGYIPRV